MFLENLIYGIALSGSIVHPADFETPFTQSCRPQQEASFEDTYFQILPVENPNVQKVILQTFDPLIQLSAAYTCICFEQAFSDIEAPVTYVDLWNFVQHLAAGETDEALRLMQPLHDSTVEIREQYEAQVAPRNIHFKTCIEDHAHSLGDIPIYTPIVIIIRGKLGLIRY